MRRLSIILVAALTSLALGSFAAAAVEGCRTGDSAICISDPNCHWKPERRGCYEGAPVQEDACAAHGDPTICDTDVTIGCKWNAESKQCKSAN